MPKLNHLTDFFNQEEIEIVEKRIFTKKSRNRDRLYIECLIREKDILLKPEEKVRQLWIARLINGFSYPKERIEVEYPISLGSTKKSADIVILDKDSHESPYIVIEVKKENRKEGKDQLKSYCNATGAQIAIWSNGQDTIFWNRKDPNFFVEIPTLPKSYETLEEIINQPWTIQTLIQKEKEREKSNKTLRGLIEDMEDEVLANAGVDVFEEVFKLIFIKMFDEIEAYENCCNLKFRNTNQNSEFTNRLNNLFKNAIDRWPGVFDKDDEIKLETDHLRVCVSSLESWKLFNSNLEIIDDAFEYLVGKSSKGEKGQYFTPRWVIDMCIMILDPKESEKIVDPACGSAGFLIHATFHNWKRIMNRVKISASQQFSIDEKHPACKKYVQNNVFGIDFDEKVVRVAKCINLIAGDGQTNVLKLNSLDWKSWKNREDKWMDVYGNGWARLRNLMADKKKLDYQKFKFDVCLANPPYSGSIKQSKLLSLYDIAIKPNGKMAESMDRDILFIERCIDFVRPGGRIAIVLPEGRFNNPSNKVLREYISERCRILAVISLHKNTFKPHTGIRTGVLFLQKWNNNPDLGQLCPRVEDYEIFCAIQKKESVNNKGLKVYVKNSKGFLRDKHGHLIVNHDLFNHDGLTENGIVEAFSKWAKKETLSFVGDEKEIRITSDKYLNKFNTKLSFCNSHKRIDPKFFAPIYENLYEKIKTNSYKTRKIKEFAVCNNRGIQPKIIEDGEIWVIKSGNILDGYLDYSQFGTTQAHLYSETKFASSSVQNNDILMYTTGANIGRTAIFNGTDPTIASNHVNIIRIEEEDPVYVAFILNSEIGRMQIEQRNSGSAQPEIYPEDIGNIEIPFLPTIEERELVQKLIEAEKLRKLSISTIQQSSKDIKKTFNLIV